MTLHQEIIAEFPELVDNINLDRVGIVIQDDADGECDYLAKWDYPKPLPNRFKLGK